MQPFESTPESVLMGKVKNRQDVTLTIAEDVTDFYRDIPDVDFSTPKEVPPTSAIFTQTGAAHIAVYSAGSDLKSKFIRFVFAVYSNGGMIHYLSNDNRMYEAHVTWPR